MWTMHVWHSLSCNKGTLYNKYIPIIVIDEHEPEHDIKCPYVHGWPVCPNMDIL